jgi:hypothetical protein
VEYYVVVIWVDGMAFLDPPAIVCRAWHPYEEQEPEESVVARLLELHDRGLVRCECFSRYAREGELGHRPQGQLYPIARSDFDRALELLEEQELEAYEEHVYHAFVRSLERLSPDDPRHHLSMPRSD